MAAVSVSERSAEARRQRLIEQGLPPALARHQSQRLAIRPGMAGRADPFRFRRDLGLSSDPTAMTLEQVDQLIAYNDALDKRYHQALARLHAVRDQIHAALRQYGGEVLADLRSTDAAPLRDAFSRALAEYDSCRRQVEAIGAYVEQLDDEPARQQ